MFLIKLTFIFLIIFSISNIVSIINVNGLTYYPNTGRVEGVNASITKYINLNEVNELSLIFTTSAVGLNFTNATISVSTDNQSFADVAVILFPYDSDPKRHGVHYSSSMNASSLAVNPAIFPYLQIEVPQIINETVVMRWSGGNNLITVT